MIETHTQNLLEIEFFTFKAEGLLSGSSTINDTVKTRLLREFYPFFNSTIPETSYILQREVSFDKAWFITQTETPNRYIDLHSIGRQLLKILKKITNLIKLAISIYEQNHDLCETSNPNERQTDIVNAMILNGWEFESYCVLKKIINEEEYTFTIGYLTSNDIYHLNALCPLTDTTEGWAMYNSNITNRNDFLHFSNSYESVLSTISKITEGLKEDDKEIPF